jgi:hypothetical protein
MYYVDLIHDRPRAFSPYITEQDINGKFLIKSDGATDSSSEAEYAWVNFFLPFELPFPDGNMFVTGSFNNWKTDSFVTPERGRMKYNYARQGYEARVLLKQGYYNYLYAFSDNKLGTIDLAQAEGSHAETGNIYTILVYYRELGDRFDKLIGIEILEK